MNKTLEELQAEIEALNAKNAELVREVRAAKAKAKGADIDPEAHAALQSEVEELRGKLDATTKAGAKQAETLSAQLKEKDSALQSHLIDGGLAAALGKVGVKPEFMDAAKALLRQKTGIKTEAGIYQAIMGDKPLGEAVAEWAQADGKHFVMAPLNQGGGSMGGMGGSAPKPFSKMSSEERTMLYRTDPAAYEAAKKAATG